MCSVIESVPSKVDLIKFEFSKIVNQFMQKVSFFGNNGLITGCQDDDHSFLSRQTHQIAMIKFIEWISDLRRLVFLLVSILLHFFH